MSGKGFPELSCDGCGHEFKNGEEVHCDSVGTYNAEDEGIDFEFYGDEYYCSKCWNTKTLLGGKKYND